MTPCWTRSWFVHPVHRSQLQHDMLLLLGLLRVSATVHSMSIRVWSWQPGVHCTCLSYIQQEKANGNSLAPEPFSHFSDSCCHRATHPNGCIFVSSRGGCTICSHGTVRGESHWFRHIRSLDFDSLADHFFCSVDSSNIRRNCIALGIQPLSNTLVHKRECWSSVTKCHRVYGGDPTRKGYGNNNNNPLQEFAVKTASALLVVSLMFSCFFCIPSLLSSLCRNLLWRVLLPYLPQFRLALHWLILWPMLRQKKHRLHFFIVSWRSASFILLNFSHCQTLCSLSFRGQSVFVGELESLVVAKFVLFVLFIVKFALALSLVETNCNLMSSFTSPIFLRHALNTLIFLWPASYLCKYVKHMFLRSFGIFQLHCSTLTLNQSPFRIQIGWRH